MGYVEKQTAVGSIEENYLSFPKPREQNEF